MNLKEVYDLATALDKMVQPVFEELMGEVTEIIWEHSPFTNEEIQVINRTVEDTLRGTLELAFCCSTLDQRAKHNKKPEYIQGVLPFDFGGH